MMNCVHTDSVFMAVLDDRKVQSNQKADSDVIETQEVPANSPQLVRAIQRYQAEGKIWVAYEAGCLGFDLYHFLEKHGIPCQIIPANTVFRPGNERTIKTDRRDAVLIGRMLKRGEALATKLPRDTHTEPGRRSGSGLYPGRGDLVDDLTRTKQRIQKFLLRHGFRYENNRYWTGPHLKWIGGLEFE